MATFDFIQTYGIVNFGSKVSKSKVSIYFYEAAVIWDEEVVWDSIEIAFSSDNPTMVYFYSNTSSGVVDKSLPLSYCYVRFLECTEKT